MIELYLLHQFAEFASAGTLSEAAEKLHLSQPALSRSMKKLEEDLGVSLFIRRKNRIVLNENGKYMLSLAQKLLDDAESLAIRVREFDRKNRTIVLGSCAPAPIWQLAMLITNSYPQMSLQTEISDDQRLLKGLENKAYQLIVTHGKPNQGPFFWKEIGRETLMFSLPPGHKYAGRASLSFAEMNGENMLLMSDIGFWNFVRTEKMPDSLFLTQHDQLSFHELVRASSLASFTSDLSEKYMGTDSARVNIPITDPDAIAIYYLVCLLENKKEYQHLFASARI